jgi:hypothetical protein
LSSLLCACLIISAWLIYSYGTTEKNIFSSGLQTDWEETPFACQTKTDCINIFTSSGKTIPDKNWIECTKQKCVVYKGTATTSQGIVQKEEISQCENECFESGCITDEKGKAEFIACFDEDNDGCLNKVHMTFCDGPNSYCRDNSWCITGGENGDIMMMGAGSRFREGDTYYLEDKKCVVTKYLNDYFVASCFNVS